MDQNILRAGGVAFGGDFDALDKGMRTLEEDIFKIREREGVELLVMESITFLEEQLFLLPVSAQNGGEVLGGQFGVFIKCLHVPGDLFFSLF